jgi:hypothetical protein
MRRLRELAVAEACLRPAQLRQRASPDRRAGLLPLPRVCELPRCIRGTLWRTRACLSLRLEATTFDVLIH